MRQVPVTGAAQGGFENTPGKSWHKVRPRKNLHAILPFTTGISLPISDDNKGKWEKHHGRITQ
jgi:hypothetical protein